MPEVAVESRDGRKVSMLIHMTFYNVYAYLK